MKYFDFHHHHFDKRHGIYNLELFAEAIEFPFSAGLHPKDIGKDDQGALLWLEEISKDRNCLAIGECGLDGLISVEIKAQEEMFLKQIEVANRRTKPVLIHCVKKHYELIPFKKLAKVPLVIHGFNKKKEVAAALMQENFLFSFGKALLHNVSLQEIVKNINSKNFFLETDDSDFDIELLYQKVSEIRKENLEAIITQINTNLDFLING